MIIYFALAAVLILAFRVDRPHPVKSARLAILFYTMIFAGTGLPFRFLQVYPPTFDGYLFVLASASFMLVLLYNSLPRTQCLAAAMVCEVSMIGLYVLCIADVKAALSNRVIVTDILNMTALFFLLWNWWGGGNFVDSRDRFRLRPAGWRRAAVGHQRSFVDSEKVQ